MTGAPARRAAGAPAGSGGPTRIGERIEVLDALRGLALFGIFVVNLSAFTLYDFLVPERQAALPFAEHERSARFAIELLFHGKFYALFSLLFGIGFAIQLERARARGGRFLGLYVRRLAILLAIGLAHLVFLWPGDILTLYALVGFALLLFRGLPGPAILACAAAFALLPVAQAWYQADTGFDAGASVASLARRASTSGDPGLADAFWRFAQLLREGREFKVLAMFLVGLWVGRRRILHDPRGHRRLLRWTIAVGLPVGLVGSAAMGAIEIGHRASADWGPVAAAALYAAGVFPLALAYAAGGALLGMHGIGRAALSVFAPAGRMALTNYLLQSVIGTELFHPPGLGYAKLGPAGWFAFAVLVFAAQIVASALWLRVFRHGPVEWLWRQLTYLRPLPILRGRETAE